MNRNTESHFSVNPTNLSIERSKFDRSSGHKTTFNAGNLIPIYLDEVLPGDTFSMDMAAAVRMSTPVFPVMDNCFLDYYFFYVPSRLCWEHWKQFNGENTESAWAQPVEYEVPQLKAPSGGWKRGTIADYFGIPTGVSNFSVNALPFRAYCLIWNEWFRDQNLKDPAHVALDDATQTGTNDGDYVVNAELGALPLKAAKIHDYFTSCLPEPQKGPDVLLPLSGLAYVRAGEDRDNAADDKFSAHWAIYGTGKYPSKEQYMTIGSEGAMRIHNAPAVSGTPVGPLVPVNLYADLASATAATVNQLRQAFAIQRLYERDARGGTRYTEIIRAHFGVTSPDARQQRPEYLGGSRIPVSMDQVVQTSGTTDTSPQGNTAAFSLTNFSGSAFTKSFTEHGYVIGLAVVRHDLTYQQGLERLWSRKKRFDFYLPALAYIGEQPVYNKEIFLQGNAKDDEAFGYQEAWADYRYKPSRVSGAFRSGDSSLDAWHYADDYDQLPMLSSGWIDQGDSNIKRTLALQTEDQFIADFYFKCTCVRPMPLYSIPGMLDHN